jgi:hypothetical protein
MIILFYSDECKFSCKLLDYIKTNNLTDFFKFINIDALTVIPKNITIVPTIVDSNIEAPLEGKKAFEYVINHKFFNYPTNNIDFWVNKAIPKPSIEEDNKALDNKIDIFAILDDDKSIPNKVVSNKFVANKVNISSIPKTAINKKTLALMKLKNT